MYRKCGSDALQYLKFQRHLIIFLLIIMLICLAIILPINFTMGNIQANNRTMPLNKLLDVVNCLNRVKSAQGNLGWDIWLHQKIAPSCSSVWTVLFPSYLMINYLHFVLVH